MDYLLTVEEDNPCPLGPFFSKKNPADMIWLERSTLIAWTETQEN